MNLLQLGKIRLSSGRESMWKIDADALTSDDIDCAAYLLAKLCGPYGDVSGVPRGGLRLAHAMRQYATEGPLLCVDDCWTTGGSVNRHLDWLASFGRDIRGAKVAVIFARAYTPPSRVSYIFPINPLLEYV